MSEPLRRRDDVVIVGAGPAGTWAAYCLARRGARVTLIDPSHPREKPCGGGVTGRALAVVRDAVDACRFPAVVVRSARFVHTASNRSAVVPLEERDGRPALVVASRREFDAALLDAACVAGATFVRERVVDVQPAGAGVTVRTAAGAWTGAVAVGADGANSLVRRRLAGPFRRDQLSIATGYFARGATSSEIVIELVSDPPGYLWSFPRPSHLAIGVCAAADGASAPLLKSRVLKWIDETGLAGRASLQAYSWPVPSLSAADHERSVLTGNGWALVGDAAGLVDPITREGIYFALRSAELLSDAVSSGGARPLAGYGERVRDEIGVELARAARLQQGFFRTPFASSVIEALQRSERVRAVMADLVAGRQGYADLRWRLVKTLEAGLAWQWLRDRLAAS